MLRSNHVFDLSLSPHSEEDPGRAPSTPTLTSTPFMFHETVSARGHLIDTRYLERIFEQVGELGASYEVVQFDIGKTIDELSTATIKVSADTRELLRETVEAVVSLGGQVESRRRRANRCSPKGRVCTRRFLLDDESSHPGTD